MKKKYIIPSVAVGILYLIVMCGVGLFGETAMHYVRLVAPYFFALLGLCVVVVLPYRIMWALERNKEIKQKIEEERRLAIAAARNKKMVAAAKRYEEEAL